MTAQSEEPAARKGTVEARTVSSDSRDGAASEAEEAATGGTRAAEGRAEIHAPPERVWRALTEAAELERWFPLEARVEPGEGGEIFMSWKNEYSGSSKILTWDPPHHLRISWGGEDDAAAQVTDYHIEGRGGRTLLRVVTSGFPPDASWDDWVEGTRLGWLFELTSLKRYLEENDGEDRRVVYLRRRVHLPRQEAWDRLFGPRGLDPRELSRSTFSVEEPRQYVGETRDPAGGLLRISTEPCEPGTRGKDVTLFLSVWGDREERLEDLEREWTALLEGLFPAGETV